MGIRTKNSDTDKRYNIISCQFSNNGFRHDRLINPKPMSTTVRDDEPRLFDPWVYSSIIKLAGIPSDENKYFFNVFSTTTMDQITVNIKPNKSQNVTSFPIIELTQIQSANGDNNTYDISISLLENGINQLLQNSQDQYTQIIDSLPDDQKNLFNSILQQTAVTNQLYLDEMNDKLTNSDLSEAKKEHIRKISKFATETNTSITLQAEISSRLAADLSLSSGVKKTYNQFLKATKEHLKSATIATNLYQISFIQPNGMFNISDADLQLAHQDTIALPDPLLNDVYLSIQNDILPVVTEVRNLLNTEGPPYSNEIINLLESKLQKQRQYSLRSLLVLNSLKEKVRIGSNNIDMVNTYENIVIKKLYSQVLAITSRLTDFNAEIPASAKKLQINALDAIINSVTDKNDQNSIYTYTKDYAKPANATNKLLERILSSNETVLIKDRLVRLRESNDQTTKSTVNLVKQPTVNLLVADSLLQDMSTALIDQDQILVINIQNQSAYEYALHHLSNDESPLSIAVESVLDKGSTVIIDGKNEEQQKVLVDIMRDKLNIADDQWNQVILNDRNNSQLSVRTDQTDYLISIDGGATNTLYHKIVAENLGNELFLCLLKNSVDSRKQRTLGFEKLKSKTRRITGSLNKKITKLNNHLHALPSRILDVATTFQQKISYQNDVTDAGIIKGETRKKISKSDIEFPLFLSSTVDGYTNEANDTPQTNPEADNLSLISSIESRRSSDGLSLDREAFNIDVTDTRTPNILNLIETRTDTEEGRRLSSVSGHTDVSSPDSTTSNNPFGQLTQTEINRLKNRRNAIIDIERTSVASSVQSINHMNSTDETLRSASTELQSNNPAHSSHIGALGQGLFGLFDIYSLLVLVGTVKFKGDEISVSEILKLIFSSAITIVGIGVTIAEVALSISKVQFLLNIKSHVINSKIQGLNKYETILLGVEILSILFGWLSYNKYKDAMNQEQRTLHIVLNILITLQTVVTRLLPYMKYLKKHPNAANMLFSIGFLIGIAVVTVFASTAGLEFLNKQDKKRARSAAFRLDKETTQVLLLLDQLISMLQNHLNSLILSDPQTYRSCNASIIDARASELPDLVAVGDKIANVALIAPPNITWSMYNQIVVPSNETYLIVDNSQISNTLNNAKFDAILIQNHDTVFEDNDSKVHYIQLPAIGFTHTFDLRNVDENNQIQLEMNYIADIDSRIDAIVLLDQGSGSQQNTITALNPEYFYPNYTDSNFDIRQLINVLIDSKSTYNLNINQYQFNLGYYLDKEYTGEIIDNLKSSKEYKDYLLNEVRFITSDDLSDFMNTKFAVTINARNIPADMKLNFDLSQPEMLLHSVDQPTIGSIYSYISHYNNGNPTPLYFIATILMPKNSSVINHGRTLSIISSGKCTYNLQPQDDNYEDALSLQVNIEDYVVIPSGLKQLNIMI